MFSPTCKYDYLYHLLRNDETDVKTNGISATHPGATLNPEKHIHFEGKQPSQFITTSISLTGIDKILKNLETGSEQASGISRYYRDLPTWRHNVQSPSKKTENGHDDNNIQRHPKIAIIKCQELTEVEYIDMTDSETRAKWLRTDKASHFAEKHKIVLIKGHIPPDCIDIYTIPPYTFLYRLLREDEWHYEPTRLGKNTRAKLNGSIKAKNPNSDVCVLTHVSVGSYSPKHSKYISTPASQQAIETFARNSKSEIKMVVKINCQLLRDVDYIDLTDKVIRDKHIPPDEERACNFAKKFQEVLLVGEISERCVCSFQEIKTETEEPVEDKSVLRPISGENLLHQGLFRSFPAKCEKSPLKTVTDMLASNSSKEDSKRLFKTAHVEDSGSKAKNISTIVNSISKPNFSGLEDSSGKSSQSSSSNQSTISSLVDSSRNSSLNDSDSQSRETSSSSNDDSSNISQLSSFHWDFYPGGI